MITAADIQAKLAAEMENDLPDQVLEVLRREEGKLLTKRILAKLPGGENAWRIDHVANMTKLMTRTYHNSGGNQGMSLLLAYQTKNVYINSEWVKEHNICHFDAREKRDAERRRVMHDFSLLSKMANTILRIQGARAQLAHAEEELEELTTYGGPFSADSHTWKEMAK